MADDLPSELRRFERGDFDPTRFPHGEHVRVAYGFLRRERFVEVLPRFARGIRTMAERAGKPEVYNETITTAFLALIAERLREYRGEDFAGFCAENPELFDKDALLTLYSRERLHSPAARATFLLPSPHDRLERGPR